jgi:hypothetical protein
MIVLPDVGPVGLGGGHRESHGNQLLLLERRHIDCTMRLLSRFTCVEPLLIVYIDTTRLLQDTQELNIHPLCRILNVLPLVTRTDKALLIYFLLAMPLLQSPVYTNDSSLLA